jgi:hypothetical protein
MESKSFLCSLRYGTMAFPEQTLNGLGCLFLRLNGQGDSGGRCADLICFRDDGWMAVEDMGMKGERNGLLT